MNGMLTLTFSSYSFLENASNNLTYTDFSRIV